jgi:hypothetical protein
VGGGKRHAAEPEEQYAGELQLANGLVVVTAHAEEVDVCATFPFEHV